jgi:hypothetical protein
MGKEKHLHFGQGCHLQNPKIWNNKNLEKIWHGHQKSGTVRKIWYYGILLIIICIIFEALSLIKLSFEEILRRKKGDVL